MKKLLPLSALMILILFTTMVFASSLLNSPSACGGQWVLCDRAFADGGNWSMGNVNSSINKTSTWYNYGFSFAENTTINEVVVRADYRTSNNQSGLSIDLKVSGDGGQTFGPSHVLGNVTTETTILIDVTNDMNWTASKLNDTNLRVNATCFTRKPTGAGICYLEWLPINVTYT